MRIAWSGARWRQRLARLCAWLAIAGFVAAMARPSVTVEPTTRAGILELVIDVSSSTQADDVAPTRLGAIQRAILRMLDRVPPRVRVGLVSFSSTAGTAARPDTDRDVVRGRIAALAALGGTAIGDALRRALGDIEAAHQAAPAWVLLVSDGSNTAGGNPLDAAHAAAAQHVPVLAVALGTPDGAVGILDETAQPKRVPVPPDPVLLASIAGPTGGLAVEARSAPELETALDDLLRRAGLAGEQRDLTMLFAAGALLLLAIGCALAPPRRRTAHGTGAWPPAAAGRWTPPVALLVAAGVTAVAWVQWLPTGPSPAVYRSAVIAKLATQPLPVPPVSLPPTALPAPPPLTIAATGRDRKIVQQAAALLGRHRLLATQRTAEIKRQHLTEIAGLEVSACDVCVTTSLTSPSSGFYPTTNGRPVCDVLLNTPFVRKQAQRAHVPVRMVAAMAILHEQELCLHDAGSGVPFETEQRLAAKLHNALLFDLLFAQIDAGGRDWGTVEQAVAILRDHGELAVQRHDEIRRRRLNQVGPLWIDVCHACRTDLIGEAWADSEAGGMVGCEILLDLSGIQREARDWGLPVTQAVASTLVHEQEHCIRDPDDQETPAIDAERRLALKLGGARLLEYATSFYSMLDRSGHWKS